MITKEIIVTLCLSYTVGFLWGAFDHRPERWNVHEVVIAAARYMILLGLIAMFLSPLAKGG